MTNDEKIQSLYNELGKDSNKGFSIKAYNKLLVAVFDRLKAYFDSYPEKTTISNTDTVLINDTEDGAVKKVTVSTLVSNVSGGGSSISDGNKGDITVSGSGATWTINNSSVNNTKLASGIDASKISSGVVSNTEFDYLNNVTSNIQTQLDGKASTTHNHNDLYYTKSETDSSLANKSDITHNHNDLYYTETEINSLLLNKSDTNHNHNDLYYTETEVDSLLANKADTNHNHNTLYYTETEIDSLLSNKADTNHTHNDLYYTETEVDSLLTGKANAVHNHDDLYYTETEINLFLNDKANLNHDHNNLYYTESEIDSFLSNKSNVGHKHDDLYYTETEVDSFLANKANISHNHNDLYYTESEIDTLLSNKSDTTHNHDSRYYTETEIDSFLANKANISHTHAQSDIINLTTDLANKQPLNSNLTGIASITPSDNDIIQRKAGVWTNRSMAQLKTDLALTKSDVGLSNVVNSSQLTKDANDIFSSFSEKMTLHYRDVFLLEDAENSNIKKFTKAENIKNFVLSYINTWTNVILTSDFTTSSASNVNVTGLSFTPSANTTYLVEIYALVRTANTTIGARTGFSFPTGLTDAGAWLQAPNSATASALRFWGGASAQNAASTGLPNTTNSWITTGQALIIVGASPSGDFQITLASETAGTNVTIKAGSVLRYMKIS